MTISNNSWGMPTFAPLSITLKARRLPANAYAVPYPPEPEAALWRQRRDDHPNLHFRGAIGCIPPAGWCVPSSPSCHVGSPGGCFLMTSRHGRRSILPFVASGRTGPGHGALMRSERRCAVHQNARRSRALPCWIASRSQRRKRRAQGYVQAAQQQMQSTSARWRLGFAPEHGCPGRRETRPGWGNAKRSWTRQWFTSWSDGWPASTPATLFGYGL